MICTLILHAEAEENNLGINVRTERWERWYKCSLCEQDYHGVVACALAWACWKTYLERPEADLARMSAMRQLGNGLTEADHDEDALPVKEAELSIARRLGCSEEDVLAVQSNLATTYLNLGRNEEALQMRRGVYSGYLKLLGEHVNTLIAALNYAVTLHKLERYAEAKTLLRKTLLVAQRVSRDVDENTLRLRWLYGEALYDDPAATLEDLREAVTTFEDTERIARRTLGATHPTTKGIVTGLRYARAALRARETPSPR